MTSSDDTERSHVVLNLTMSEASDLYSILDMTGGDVMTAGESGTKKKVVLELLKQGVRSGESDTDPEEGGELA